MLDDLNVPHDWPSISPTVVPIGQTLGHTLALPQRTLLHSGQRSVHDVVFGQDVLVMGTWGGMVDVGSEAHTLGQTGLVRQVPVSVVRMPPEGRSVPVLIHVVGEHLVVVLVGSIVVRVWWEVGAVNGVVGADGADTFVEVGAVAEIAIVRIAVVEGVLVFSRAYEEHQTGTWNEKYFVDIALVK